MRKRSGDDPVYLCVAFRGGASITLPFPMSRDTASGWMRDWYTGTTEAYEAAKKQAESEGSRFTQNAAVACGPCAMNTAGDPNWALAVWDRASVVAMWVLEAALIREPESAADGE